jgi:phosphatidylglycerophosphate synthase
VNVTFGPANFVTAVRALLVLLVAGMIGRPPDPTAVVFLGAIATALDGVDGWVARRTKTESAFGARFDVEVDALLILALAVLVWRYGKAGAWVLASGLLRYLFVAAGSVMPWMNAPLAPTKRARIICVVQIGGLLIALLPAVEPPASSVIAAVALVALIYSFAVDVGRLWAPLG